MQCDSMQPAQQMAWPHYLKPLKRPHVTNKANEEQEREYFQAGYNQTESMSWSTIDYEPVHVLCTGRILSLLCHLLTNLWAEQLLCDSSVVYERWTERSTSVQSDATVSRPLSVIIQSSETFLT